MHGILGEGGLMKWDQGGISLSVLSVFFTDKFALSQSDARISVAYNLCQWKALTKRLMKCPPDLTLKFMDSSYIWVANCWPIHSVLILKYLKYTL